MAMDQVKIGKFIAECRKKQNLTQMQLAEKFNITDRAVSKWETGKTLPDSAIMLDLCEVLGITVNDLLNGEVISSDEYAQKTATQLVEVIQQKEAVENRLLSIKTMLEILSIIFTVPYIIVLVFVPTVNMVLFSVLFFLYILAFFVFSRLCEKVAHLVGYYQCPRCNHIYKPEYKEVQLSIGFGRKRQLKCPNCKKNSWHIKVITKE